jgi:hypothetical protein
VPPCAALGDGDDMMLKPIAIAAAARRVIEEVRISTLSLARLLSIRLTASIGQGD